MINLAESSCAVLEPPDVINRAHPGLPSTQSELGTISRSGLVANNPSRRTVQARGNEHSGDTLSASPDIRTAVMYSADWRKSLDQQAEETLREAQALRPPVRTSSEVSEAIVRFAFD